MDDPMEQGSCRLIVYLRGVTESEVDEHADELMGWVKKRGLATGDEDEPLLAVVAVEPWEWPDTPEEFVHVVGKNAARVLIPADFEEQKEAES